MAGPPLALIFSIAGLVKDRSKKYAIAGLAISGLTCSLWLLALLWR